MSERIIEACQTWHVPTEGSLLRARIAVVLVRGRIDDCTAYIGIGSSEWVAEHGDKLGRELATALFPGRNVETRYRE